GSVMSGGRDWDSENMLGMFGNRVVYGGGGDDEKRWDELMGEMKEMCVGGYEDEEYGFERLVNDVVDERDG
ncbi:hypothetical protein, partial [Staphylococcus epidermidis]|uniref:hypothetical protein n=1 Tax=Staphylococcus epidermidis TaxID=1282 RepID=UPI001C92E3E2